jgi:hypothetical protein
MDKRLPFSLGGVPLREPYPSESAFFRGNKHVAGMATEDDKIALNPYSGLTQGQQDAVAQNEASRVWMRRPEFSPEVDLTPEQQQAFAAYGQPKDQKATVIARIISGDSSAGQPTQQQLEFAQRLAASMARYDINRGGR